MGLQNPMMSQRSNYCTGYQVVVAMLLNVIVSFEHFGERNNFHYHKLRYHHSCSYYVLVHISGSDVTENCRSPEIWIYTLFCFS